MKEWSSVFYAFFKTPYINYASPKKRLVQVFHCAGRGCKHVVNRYLHTGDMTLTKSLGWHAKSCWGEDAVWAARKANNLAYAREHVASGILKLGSITAHFERKGDQSHTPIASTRASRHVLRLQSGFWS